VLSVCFRAAHIRPTDYSLFYYFLLWIALLCISLIFIGIHGIDYVSWPRLIPSTDYIYYSGPGFRSAHHGKGFGGDDAPKTRSGTSISTKWLNSAGKKRISVAVEEGEKKRVD
jgi:hypothetical protein